MIKHEEVRKDFQTLKNKRIYADWGDTLYDFNHKIFDNIEQYIAEQEKKAELIKHLIVLVNRYLGAVSYDIDQTNYGLDIVKDIKETVKQLEEEMKWENHRYM